MPKDSPLKSYALQFFKAALSFLAVVIYSRMLGAEGRGVLSLLLLYLQIVLMVNEVVTGSVMANWFVKYGFREVFFLLLKITVLVLFTATIAAILIWPTWWREIVGLAIIGLSLSWQNIVGNFYQSVGRVVYRNVLALVYEGLKVLLLCLFFVGCWMGVKGIEFNVRLILFGLAAAGFLWSLFAVFKMIQSGVFVAKSAKNIPKIGGLIGEGFMAQLGHVMLFFIYKLPLVLAAMYSGNALTGVFANALLIADVFWLFGNSFGMVIHSKALLDNRIFVQNKWVYRYMGYSAAGTSLMLIGFALLPNVLFTGVFGADFIDLKGYVLGLFPGILCLAISAPLGHLLHARNDFFALFKNHFLALGGFVFVFYGFKLYFSVEESLIFALNSAFSVVLILNFLRLNLQFGKAIKSFNNLLVMVKLFFQTSRR
jgi:O-antigen/teichoic acid export membrane protein